MKTPAWRILARGFAWFAEATNLLPFRLFHQPRMCLCVLAACLCGTSITPANTLDWNTREDRVSANIDSEVLHLTLKKVAAQTDWRIYLEPGTTAKVSAKFANLAPGEALQLLLGDLNYALVPDPAGKPRLFVFRTTRQAATELISSEARIDGMDKAGKVIPRELIVRLKPGAKIEEWARLLGAKITGRIDGLNAYRLEFEDEQSADLARKQLEASSDVESVENNYSIDRPADSMAATGPNLPPPVRLTLNPPPENGQIIVGLIDTQVQSLGPELDKFLLKSLQVAGMGGADSGMSHGTSMAGTILRSLQEATGGSTSVQILPVDVYGANPNTSTFAVAQGIVAAANGGARIINLSLGSAGDDGLLRSVIQQAYEKNIPIFAAAGNEPVTTPVYPAAYPEVQAVTAVENGQLASYASRGTFVSLGVPGTSIVYYQDRPYQIVGTSAASAAAAGVAAGYMDATRSTAAQMEAFMRNRFGVKITTGGSK